MSALTYQQKSQSTNHRAFTVSELMIAVAIGSLVTLVLVTLLLYSSRAFAAISNYVHLNVVSRTALDRMTREIRQVASLTAFQTNEVSFLDVDGVSLKYSWSPDTRQVTRESPVGAQPEVYLSECDSLKFEMFQRTPQVGTNNFTPTTQPGSCKLLSVRWRCSRFYFNGKENTETVQTTRVVLRNKH